MTELEARDTMNFIDYYLKSAQFVHEELCSLLYQFKEVEAGAINLLTNEIEIQLFTLGTLLNGAQQVLFISLD